MLRVWISTQAPLPIKNGLARIFGLPEFKVEVIAPDVGGGFGTKIMLFYPGGDPGAVRGDAPRPAREVDRGPASSTCVAASQERGQLHDVEVAFDDDGPHPRRCATASCTTRAPTRRTASSCR